MPNSKTLTTNHKIIKESAFIDSMPYKVSILDDILYRSYKLILDGHYKPAASELMLNLKSFFDTYPFKDNQWIQDRCLDHPINELIQQDPCTYRGMSRPRGYAGDAVLIDYYYRLNGPTSKTTHIGRELFDAFIESSASESVRWRAVHLSELITNLHYRLKKPLTLLSIASGHLREIAYIENFEEKVHRLDALDQDKRSNDLVRETYDYSNLNIIDAKIRHVIGGRMEENEYDFIYSAGLFDYLEDKVAKRLIAKMYRSLKKGAKMLVPNFAPGLQGQAYMETFMNWHLIYRTEGQMLSLCSELQNLIKPSDVKLYRDPNFNVIYMEITKSK